MHPFGGTPICPRCEKAVYLAEQTMGPGRKLYHKPCLACTVCNKRLDSYTLLEHDERPYCKSCHLKNFGTRDLRHANLPLAPPPGADSPVPTPTSFSPTKAFFPSSALVRPSYTGTGPVSHQPSGNSTYSTSSAALPRLRPNRSLATSPISPTFSRGSNPLSPTYTGNIGSRSSSAGTPSESDNHDAIAEENEQETEAIPNNDSPQDEVMEESYGTLPQSGAHPSNTGRPGIGTIPRTIPLYLNGNGSRTPRTPYKHHTSQSVGSLPGNFISSPSTTRSKDDTDMEDSPVATSHTGNGTPLSRSAAFSSSPGSFAPISPLKQTATGTRYGVALTGGMPSPSMGVGVHMTGSGGSPRKWGAGTPLCARCGKSVYFAEQAKAVGKTFHKNCLRCVECSSSLDSNRLRDHDGEPYCVRCYQKHHGPQGSGYALLGKAGG